MNASSAHLISLGSIWKQWMPEKPCAGRNCPRENKYSFDLHFANVHPKYPVWDWERVSPGVISLPRLISAPVTGLRCTCCFCLIVRMLQSSLKAREGLSPMAVLSFFAATFQLAIRISRGNHSSCSQPPILPINKMSQNSTSATLGVWALPLSWGCWQGLLTKAA